MAIIRHSYCFRLLSIQFTRPVRPSTVIKKEERVAVRKKDPFPAATESNRFTRFFRCSKRFSRRGVFFFKIMYRAFFPRLANFGRRRTVRAETENARHRFGVTAAGGITESVRVTDRCGGRRRRPRPTVLYLRERPVSWWWHAAEHFDHSTNGDRHSRLVRGPFQSVPRKTFADEHNPYACRSRYYTVHIRVVVAPCRHNGQNHTDFATPGITTRPRRPQSFSCTDFDSFPTRAGFETRRRPNYLHRGEKPCHYYRNRYVPKRKDSRRRVATNIFLVLKNKKSLVKPALKRRLVFNNRISYYSVLHSSATIVQHFGKPIEKFRHFPLLDAYTTYIYEDTFCSKLRLLTYR